MTPRAGSLVARRSVTVTRTLIVSPTNAGLAKRYDISSKPRIEGSRHWFSTVRVFNPDMIEPTSMPCAIRWPNLVPAA